MHPPTSRLSRGERAPDFVLPCQDGTPTRFYAKAGGKPTVLLFYNTDAVDTLMRFVEELHRCAADTVALCAVRYDNSPGHEQNYSGNERLFPIFADTQGAVKSTYRLDVTGPTVLFVLDPNLRILASLGLGEDAGSAASQVIACLDAFLPRVDPLEITMQAPVLLIPHVLDPETCQELHNVWETQGNVATGIEHSAGNRREDTISPELKRRRDHIVRNEQLLRRLASTIGRRVIPEIHRAFLFKASRFEGFKIACYDATTGGFFRAHRDNLSPATAHRRFALSLNLNAGYEGGYLRFPEYGPHLYRPDAGSALIFSCSHLHEVTEVTQGQRFVLLSFLFGEGDVRTPRAPSKERASALPQ